MIPAETYVAGPVTLDGLVTVLGQYAPGVRWNGWLCPSIDALAVVTVIEELNSNDDLGEVITADWREDGAVVVTELTYVGEEGYAPDVIAPDADGLYPLGAFAWVWSEGVAAEVAR